MLSRFRLARIRLGVFHLALVSLLALALHAASAVVTPPDPCSRAQGALR